MPLAITEGGPGPAPPELQNAVDFGRRPRRAYAALDLGTNNCRLLIARPARQGFYVIDAFSRIVRLGEGLMQTGALTEIAQQRAIDALRICADKLRRREVWMARNVATEACRRASNGQDFVARVYEETGIALDVITPKEEARLAVLGCQTLIETGYEQALVFDIGGGSTELILVDLTKGHAEMLAWTSVPWGVVSLAETQPADFEDPHARRIAYAQMVACVADEIAPFAAQIATELKPAHLQLLGTSGTVTTLASLYMDLPNYDRRIIDGCWVPSQAMRDISQRLAGMRVAERAAVPCIGPERADLVIAGCAILEAILDRWPMERLRVADRGIREGILRTLMARDGGR